MVKKIIILVTLVFIGGILEPARTSAVEIVPTDLGHKHFAGVRIGAWTSTGGSSALNDSLQYSKSSIYAEFFYAHRFVPALAGELSIGIFSRGDFHYLVQQDVLLGTVNLYPIMLSAKIYPLAGLSGSKIYPYIQAGGCLFFGRRTATDYYYGYDFVDQSDTKITYVVGGGIDFQVADQIGLTSNVKYIPVKFGSPLAGIKDYSGWQVSFGVGYIFGKKH
ncbi:hypothetical protein TRIP_C60222 [Candidatus Zixiibacteriota bacterium]|nr:hypothetical protein TRIP_C60222 [candidate division Zixibacteria bacterium]